jgi:D-tyrosyl-tRNA(Tyr) deacylase
VSGQVVGAIGSGLLAFVGIQRGDDGATVERMAGRIAGYRMFADERGRMNRSVRDIGGAVLLVSQFTLAADTEKGLRPGFSSAAEPGEARRLCDALAAGLRDSGLPVAEGGIRRGYASEPGQRRAGNLPYQSVTPLLSPYVAKT